ncbi:MAG: hypothetical protein FWF78_00890 [Defluviitaleaceae bacterium]|nr:hypothetical protein [Defluviitaleaceae bacterium]
MKRVLTIAVMLFTFIALAACNGNGAEPPIETPSEQNEHNPAHIANEPIEELKIQIAVATDELLNTFANVHHADVRGVYGHDDGATLVIWANQTLLDFSVLALASDWLEDTLMFKPTYGFGSLMVLPLGDAFVIENYMGMGTLPHRGITFSDKNGENIRVFFFQENNAYPEHGGKWMIQEIEADRLVWGFSYDVEFPSEIFINGVRFVDDAYGNADVVYSVAGQLPTHVTMGVLWGLGLDAISAGSQNSLQYNGGSIGIGLSTVNYLAFGTDRVAVGIDDTFMADDGYFTTYVPISLIRYLGFDVYFESGRVYIDGEFNLPINPHPLALALQNFVDNAEGETQAHVTNVGGNTSVLAIEFIDTFFTEATLFVYTGREVLTKEIGSIDGFPFSVGFTTDGRGSLVKLTGDGGNASYAMFSVDTNPATLRDEIVILFTIYVEREDLPNFDHRFNYYHHEGGWLQGIEGGRNPITEEEFYAIRDGMGDRITSWRDITWDSTESILSWVAPNWFAHTNI